MIAPDASDHAWFDEFYTAPTTTAASAARVTLIVDGERLARAQRRAETADLGPGLTFEGRERRWPRWRDGDTELALDAEVGMLYQVHGDVVEVVAAERGRARVGWLRAVRELHERALNARGFALVHASAVALPDGRVILVAGPRQSGKSTLLVYLLTGGASYVSNDRVAVDASGHAIGVPTIVSLRQGTFDHLPGLPAQPAAWRHGWVHRHTLAELAALEPPARKAHDHPPTCTPAHFRNWLGVGETRTGSIAAVLFPEIGDGPEPRLVSLPDDDARERLRAARIAQDDDGLLAGRGRVAAIDEPTLPAFICRVGAYPAGGARALMDELRYHLEARAPVVGWDLSRLEGRMILEALPWSYDQLAAEALRASTAALDLGTGGGERLATLANAAGGTLVATEAVPANVELARARLGPLGIEVRARAHGTPLPFADASFDLVLSRHAGFGPKELARVLRPGGRFLTEQTDPISRNELRAAFGRPPEVARDIADACARAGLAIDELRRVEVQRRFTDIDALVAYLSLIPWIVPGFSVADDLQHLRRLDDRRPLAFRAWYVLLRAHRPPI